MKKPVAPDVALSRLQQLCSRSEHCTAELMTKLTAWCLTPSQAKTIVDSLKRDRFVDNSRFARAYAADKMRFGGWGKFKIIKGLMVKHIERDDIDAAIDSLDSDEYRATCRRVLIAKARAVKEGNTPQGRTKLLRHAASRGFEPSLVIQLIRAENLWEPNQL